MNEQYLQAVLVECFNLVNFFDKRYVKVFSNSFLDDFTQIAMGICSDERRSRLIRRIIQHRIMKDSFNKRRKLKQFSFGIAMKHDCDFVEKFCCKM